MSLKDKNDQQIYEMQVTNINRTSTKLNYGDKDLYAYTETYYKSMIGKCVFVLQPNSTANEMKKAKEVLDELIDQKASVVYIVDNPNEKYLNPKLKKVEERYCMFDCF